jgi:hypothetical protein
MPGRGSPTAATFYTDMKTALVTHGTRVDVNLAAQVITLGVTDAVMAVMNVGHLSRFVPAALWPDITAT